MELLIEIGIGCMCIMFLTISGYFINQMKSNKRSLWLDKYEIDMNVQIDYGLGALLDRLILDAFDEYLILNVEYKDIGYVDGKLEDIITREVSRMVIESISPVIMTKLSTLYNMDKFADIVSKKVYLKTMDYSLAKNEGQTEVPLSSYREKTKITSSL